jgi:cell division protease FtsH
MLKKNEDILHAMAAALMKYETIDKYQIDDLMERKPVRAPKGWDDTPPSNDGVEADLWSPGAGPTLGGAAEQG